MYSYISIVLNGSFKHSFKHSLKHSFKHKSGGDQPEAEVAGAAEARGVRRGCGATGSLARFGERSLERDLRRVRCEVFLVTRIEVSPLVALRYVKKYDLI